MPDSRISPEVILVSFFPGIFPVVDKPEDRDMLRILFTVLANERLSPEIIEDFPWKVAFEQCAAVRPTNGDVFRSWSVQNLNVAISVHHRFKDFSARYHA
jgi:hypothetical protein